MSTQQDADKEAELLLQNLDVGEIDEGYHYAHTDNRAESFMIAGNGPSAWVWFVFDTEGAWDHAYIEYVDSEDRAFVEIPHHKIERLYNALHGR